MSFFDPVKPISPLRWAFMVGLLLGLCILSMEVSNRMVEGFINNPYDTRSMKEAWILIFGFLLRTLSEEK